MEDDALLSAAQVAERLGVDRSHIARLVKLGRLPAQRVGRSYVFRAGDVAAYQPKHGGWPRGRPRKRPEGASE